MDLKDLNNTQLILLALLVSFVTSVATGIVTVTLMDQAPPGVTQTINRVVEKTVQVVAPPEKVPVTEVITETVIIKEEDLVIKAVEKNESNVVKMGTLAQEGIRILGIGSRQEPAFTELSGSGFVVSSGGLVVTERGMVADQSKQYAMKTKEGEIVLLEVIAGSAQGDVALLEVASKKEDIKTATTTPVALFQPVTFADARRIKIGQTAIALSSANGISLQLGVISKRNEIEISRKTEDGETVTEKKLVRLSTTMNAGASYSGGAVLNSDAEVLGIMVVTAEGEQFVVPANIIEEMLALQAKETVAAKPEKAHESKDQTANAGAGVD